MHVALDRPIQRRSSRVVKTVSCHYEVCEYLDRNNLFQVQGVADILDQSIDGILLSMEFAPRLGQIIELSRFQSFLSSSVSLYEVRWTQAELTLKARRRIYRVGCRLVFGLLD